MIVDRHRKRLFGNVLTDHMLIEQSPDFHRFRHPNIRRLPPRVFVEFLVEDALADIDATVTNVDAGTGDQLAHFGVALATERAHRQVRSASHIFAFLKSSFYSS